MGDRRTGRFESAGWQENYKKVVRWWHGYSITIKMPQHRDGKVHVHFDEARVVDGHGDCRTTDDFHERFYICGVYGIVDPITDEVVYVGRSSDIGTRFRQHLSPWDMNGSRDKRLWIYDLLDAGFKPGLCVLSTINSPMQELKWIKEIRPRFNRQGLVFAVDKEGQEKHAPTEGVLPAVSASINRAAERGASLKYRRSLKAKP